jgi:hypothetical protein
LDGFTDLVVPVHNNLLGVVEYTIVSTK